jgi:hypothetical protein
MALNVTALPTANGTTSTNGITHVIQPLANWTQKFRPTQFIRVLKITLTSQDPAFAGNFQDTSGSPIDLYDAQSIVVDGGVNRDEPLFDLAPGVGLDWNQGISTETAIFVRFAILG